MQMRTRAGRLLAMVGMALPLALLWSAPTAARAAESMSVNLAATTGPATHVGEGFLYGISQDATLPANQFLQPLGVNAYRGAGHASRGWIGDNYAFGSGTRADITEAVTQARRLNHAQYQVILADLYGADGSQPSNTTYPCASGNCSNWTTFIDDVIGAIKSSGVSVAYDVWNEPDESIFWAPGMNTTQYFNMWDTGVKEIEKDAPGATIVGPSLAADPAQNPSEWTTWIAHAKSAGTLPTEISDHLEGDGDDPVAVAKSIDSDLSADGISAIPLTANEWLPQNQQTAGQSAWYLARFAQSGYANAARGNWNC